MQGTLRLSLAVGGTCNQTCKLRNGLRQTIRLSRTHRWLQKGFQACQAGSEACLRARNRPLRKSPGCAFRDSPGLTKARGEAGPTRTLGPRGQGGSGPEFVTRRGCQPASNSLDLEQQPASLSIVSPVPSASGGQHLADTCHAFSVRSHRLSRGGGELCICLAMCRAAVADSGRHAAGKPRAQADCALPCRRSATCRPRRPSLAQHASPL